jgi:hypothetical protein
MAMPIFTAEASLYRTSFQINMALTNFFSDGERNVMPRYLILTCSTTSPCTSLDTPKRQEIGNDIARIYS